MFYYKTYFNFRHPPPQQLFCLQTIQPTPPLTTNSRLQPWSLSLLGKPPLSKYAQGSVRCVFVPCLAGVGLSGRASSSDRCLGPRQLRVRNPVGNPAGWGCGHLWQRRRGENCVPSGRGSHSQGEGYQWRRLERLSTAPCRVRRHGPAGSLERALQQRWKKRSANVVFTVSSWNVWDELHGFLPDREIFEQVDR